jgi:hypothetical protein
LLSPVLKNPHKAKRLREYWEKYFQARHFHKARKKSIQDFPQIADPDGSNALEKPESQCSR